MFTRRTRDAASDDGFDEPDGAQGGSPSGPRFGVGAQVYVLDSDEDPATPFPYGPTGVIVRAGGSAWQGVSAIGGSARTWSVEFASAQLDRDGEGPVTSASVAERFLRLAPPLG
jgi:hypothetical protein